MRPPAAVQPAQQAVGMGQLSGTLVGLAVVHKRQLWGASVQELKVKGKN